MKSRPFDSVQAGDCFGKMRGAGGVVEGGFHTAKLGGEGGERGAVGKKQGRGIPDDAGEGVVLRPEGLHIAEGLQKCARVGVETGGVGQSVELTGNVGEPIAGGAVERGDALLEAVLRSFRTPAAV
mgnify:CR=1 FL=1